MDEDDIKNDKTGFWNGLGFGLAMFGMLFGAGSCVKQISEGDAMMIRARNEVGEARDE